MAGKRKYYVVWEGNNPGIYDSWQECKRQVEGYEHAKYKSFATLEEATKAFRSSYREYYGKKAAPALSSEELQRIGRPLIPSICVDAACSGNPGVLEYQGVDTENRTLLFHVGPFRYGTVNLGEFLALVHGIAFLKQRGLTIPVYSDSRTAIAWLRDKKIKTMLPRDPATAELFEIIDQAVEWIRNNKWENPVLKWETEAWGEIPADFGRK